MTFIHTRKCKKCEKLLDTENCWYCRELKKRDGDGKRN